MSIRRSRFTPFLIIGSLLFYVILQLYIATPGSKQTTRSLASECGQSVTGNEVYSGLLKIGPKVATNIGAANYKQIRESYNCQNEGNVRNGYIPTTVIYDLFFLKSGDIAQDLRDMKKYGLYPIIRVASYMTDENWIKLFPPTDAKIMGEKLSAALSQVGGFPQKPIVYFGNEPNLHAEWGGKTNPDEFAQSFATFIDAMGNGNFSIYFPPLSYGANGGNGISPQDFLSGFFTSASFAGKKLSGAAFTIYGSDYANIKSQLADQTQAVERFPNFFNQPPGILISEMGPIRGGGAISDCNAGSDWQNLAKPIISDFLNDPQAPLATMACFTQTQTLPVVINYTNGQNQLITLNGAPPNTGGATNQTGNAGGTTTNTTIGGGAGGTSINFSPQNPAPNTDFSVTTTATTSYSWVYLKITKQGETNPFWQAANNLADEPSVSQGPPASWTYHIGKGKPAVLPAGDYKVTFYSDCDKGCSERASRTLSIGNNKTNETQTPPSSRRSPEGTKAGQQAKPAQNPQPQQNPQAGSAKPDAKFCNKLYIRAGRKKYNLVILSAGYASSQDFLNDARIAINSLNKTNLSPNTRNKINIWAYADTSIDLRAGFCDSREICVDQNAARNFAQTCGGDGYVVILNNKSEERGVSYAVCGGEAAITNAMVDGGIRPFPHELGHSIACLDDEYLIENYGRAPRINCSTDSSCSSWQKYSGVGCYQTCSSEDRFRSTPTSLMNGGRSFTWQFNPPSLEGWDNKLQDYE